VEKGGTHRRQVPSRSFTKGPGGKSDFCHQGQSTGTKEEGGKGRMVKEERASFTNAWRERESNKKEDVS